ncbi:MAG: primosomal replication protein N [Betaproteobacteria bacterium]
MGEADANQVTLSGTLVELGALRYTPAGLPAVEFRILHESAQREAGSERKVRAEMPAVAFDILARQVAAAGVGSALRAQGFLAAKSQRSAKVVLHVTNIEFMEGAI